MTALMKVHIYGKSAEVDSSNPAFSLHTGRTSLPYTEIFAIIGDGGKQWREKFKVSSKRESLKQIKEVIQFFNDTRNPFEKKRHYIRLYKEDPDVARYEDDLGMSGWLDPAGIFHPCGYGEHVCYALDLANNGRPQYENDLQALAANQHIPMSWMEESTGSLISILGELTPSQIDWFNRFFYKLAPRQRWSLTSSVEKQGIKLKYEW